MSVKIIVRTEAISAVPHLLSAQAEGQAERSRMRRLEPVGVKRASNLLTTRLLREDCHHPTAHRVCERETLMRLSVVSGYRTNRHHLDRHLGLAASARRQRGREV